MLRLRMVGGRLQLVKEKPRSRRRMVEDGLSAFLLAIAMTTGPDRRDDGQEAPGDGGARRNWAVHEVANLMENL